MAPDGGDCTSTHIPVLLQQNHWTYAKKRKYLRATVLRNSSEMHQQAYHRPADGILSMLQHTIKLLLCISQYIRSVRRYLVFEMRSHNVAACLAVRGQVFGTGPDATGDIRYKLISVLSE